MMRSCRKSFTAPRPSSPRRLISHHPPTPFSNLNAVPPEPAAYKSLQLRFFFLRPPPG